MKKLLVLASVLLFVTYYTPVYSACNQWFNPPSDASGCGKIPWGGHLCDNSNCLGTPQHLGEVCCCDMRCL